MQYKKAILASSSEERLGRLIEARLKPGADHAAIDQHIWDLFGEEWAVMFTDLSGFSRNVVKFGIIHFLQTIFESERLFVPIIEAHDGILLKQEGDSFLLIFRNPRRAIDAAIEMQSLLVSYNKDKAAEDKVLLCLGIGYGKVLRIGDADVFGHEVNAASKLGEDTAKAGEILVTKPVMEYAVDNKSPWKFEEIEETSAGFGAAYRLLY